MATTAFMLVPCLCAVDQESTKQTVLCLVICLSPPLCSVFYCQPHAVDIRHAAQSKGDISVRYELLALEQLPDRT
jgi:hypothetical protein